MNSGPRKPLERTPEQRKRLVRAYRILLNWRAKRMPRLPRSGSNSKEPNRSITEADHD